MTFKRTLAVFLLGLGGVCAASQAVKISDIILPIDNQPTSKIVKFPAIKKADGKTAVMKFRLFYDRPQPGGWNPLPTIILNGQQLSRFTAAGEERLLRRGKNMIVTDGTVDWWSKSSGLLTLFGPGTGEVDQRIIAPREEGYWYHLDISDWVNYIEMGLDDRIESAKENTLQLNSTLTIKLAGGLKSCPLTFKDAQIIYIDNAQAAKLRPAQPLTRIKPAPVTASISNSNIKVSVTRSGGLILERNGEKYFYSAAYSYPAKSKMKFDRFSADVSKNRAGWNPVIVKKDNVITITASAADRKVVRTLQFNKDGLLEITDAVTNLTKVDMGVYSFFNVIAQNAIKPNDIYLGGMQGITAETGVGANPTLFIRGKRSGFGAMAYDDAFRCHLELAKISGNSADLRNPAGIKPGETYTQKQLVMLTNSNDYFEFINTLRRNLGMNRTLNGPISLGVRPYSQGVQLRWAVDGSKTGWFEYGSRSSLERTRGEFEKLYQEEQARCRKLHPEIKLLVKMEMSPLFIDMKKIKNGHLLPNPGPALTGKYGEIISKEATRIIEEGTPFGDSILRAADGRAIVDMYYPNGNDNIFSLLVYAYKNNAYEKHITEQVLYLLKEGNADGIYIDQFANGTMYNMTTAKDRTSYDRWDGRSVVLNADGTIKMKVFDIGYACAPSRAKLIRHVLERGKAFLANTQPVTTSEAEAGGLRFYETDCENLGAMLMGTGKPGTFRHQAFAQLSPSPLLLGTRPGMFTKDNRNFARMYNRAFICGLRHGLLYIHYSWSTAAKCYSIVNYMFPMTPVELGEGFVIGKERIITAVSRKFTVDVKPHTIAAFDAVGNKLDAAKVATVKALKNGKYEVDVKLNDWNSTCAIVLEGFATPADEAAYKAEAARKKPHKRSGKYPKVLFGPTRSSKYHDPQAEEIGNAFRFYTRDGRGVRNRIKECIKNKTPFIIQEIVDREDLKGPVEKLFDKRMKPSEIADLLKEAGDLYMGREIVGEFGGMVYWPENSVIRVFRKLKPAKDLVEARKNYYEQLVEFTGKDRSYGGGPFLSVCSCMSFPPLDKKLFDTFQLEMMPGDPERLSSAFRGASRAYGMKKFNTLIAHGWYGGATWDELFFKRFQNALNFAYMSGYSAIFSESGHFGWPFYGYKIRREDPRAQRFRNIMRDFKNFCEVDERPTNGPETPMAFMQGNLDGWPGLWAYNVWGQFTPDFAVGEPEYGWKLTDAVYQKSTWFNHDNLGKTDNSGQPPCGMYDIVPTDIPQDKLNRYKLIIIPGWNTMTDELYSKLCKFVENGGTLVMTLSQMRTNIKRNEPMKIYNNGDFSKLFGVKIKGMSPVEITGVKFPKNRSANGKYVWVNWGLNSDAKFSSNGTYYAGNIVENNADVLALCSKNFTGSMDKKEEQVPILLEHKLGKGHAIFVNSEKFPGHPALFDLMRYIMTVLMRGEQPADLDVTATNNIRYAVYGKSIYVTNTDCDFDGFFMLNGKQYQLKPQQMIHIER